MHVLDGLGGLGHGDRQRGQADRTPGEATDDRIEDRTVHLVQTEAIDAEHRKPPLSNVGIDVAVSLHVGIVLHSSQQPVGNARRAPRAPCDLPGTIGAQRSIDDGGRALHDRLEVGGLVIVEAGHQPEAITQRAGDQPGTGGGAHQRELWQVKTNRPGGGALTQHDVELEVFDRRVQHLLHRPRQAVDLVDEQHVARADLGQDGRQVARVPAQGHW